MGIYGLTTYVERHSDQFFERLQLKDCCLVIDGNSLAAQLYLYVYKSNSAFGGDYDCYADCVRYFFSILRKCNVTPMVLFDGGCEVKKMKTLRSRYQSRICDARKVNPIVQMKRSVFPLCTYMVFKDVVSKMGIKFVQCAFEADHEIAAVARALNCPVLSYDSDFYIFDVIYIPYDKLCLEVVITEELPNGDKCYALECKVYKVENFLYSFGGLDKSVLPLMATVLGNDYIDKKVFHNFFSQIKHPKSRTSSDTQRHIVGLLTWLKGKTLQGAIAMILACIKQQERQNVLKQLNKSIRGYSRTSSVLPLLCPDSSVDELTVDATCFVVGDPDDTGLAHTLDQPTAEENVFEALPQWFKDSFHKGLITTSMLDIITLRIYFCQAQVEDYSLPHSHELSLTILPVIFGLLTAQRDDPSGLTIIYRSKNAELRKMVVDPVTSMKCLDPFPPLEDLPNVPRDVRESVLLESVGLDDKHKLLLEKIPEEWRLFVVAIVFWAQRTTHLRSSLQSMISAILLTAVSLNVVDGYVGYFRTRKDFLRRHGSKVKKFERSEKNTEMSDEQCDDLVNGVWSEVGVSDRNLERLYCDENSTISENLKNVSEKDCFHFLETFVLFRYFDDSIKRNPKLYNVTVVHALAQFQSCLLHVMCLNSVLNFPLDQCKIGSFFSGTAVYNLYVNFQKQTSLSLHIVQLFGKSASVLKLFFSLRAAVASFLPSEFMEEKANSKSKKKKSHRRKNVQDNSKYAAGEATNGDLEIEEDVFIDENNRFSALSGI